MNIDFELYKIFYVVAKNLHMSKAVDELFISQSAVSQAIKKLEKQLNGLLNFIILNEDDKEHDNLEIHLINKIEHCFVSKNDLDLKTIDLKDLNNYMK